jgi:Transporter associated domain
LDDCNAILSLNLDEDEPLRSFATLSGFLCMCAGEIPNVGDFVMCRDWCFEIVHADDKKILQVRVERLVGGLEESKEHDDPNDNILRSFLKRNLGADEGSEESHSKTADDLVTDDLEKVRLEKNEQAREVERLVGSGRAKMELTSKALSEIEESS